MGIYLPNMEMPNNCQECVCINDEYFYCQAVNRKPKDENIISRRPDWCPLAEVPTPHGRLIDADELQRQFERMANEEWNKNIAVSAASCFDDAAVIVEDAPTIIEAEEGD